MLLLTRDQRAEELEVNELAVEVESNFYGLDGEERTWTSLMKF